MKKILNLVLFSLFLFPTSLLAGPPYDTDDPVPVDFHHWEFYCSSVGFVNENTVVSTAPHIEVNYGPFHNVQLHIITPMSYVTDKEKSAYGYGDTELGMKFRFVNRDSGRFQIGVFPLIELPTGNANKDLGSGNTSIYIPIWIQKAIGKWTSYGGGGYWINPGKGNQNYEFVGCQTQYQIIKSTSIGCEAYYVTASQIGGKGDFRFRLGSVIDFNDYHHLLFSIGRSIIGDTNLQWYLGYQLTI
ncbi:MAG: hypothetical protein ABI199_04865 [Bacteroidia bacterium]